MFENLFNKSPTPIPPATETDKSPASPPDRASPPIDASVVSDGEIQGWRDRIRAAESDDAALLQLAHQAPTRDLKVAAIEALTQEDSFRQAMHAFREHDKRVYRAAQSRWQAAKTKREATAEAHVLIAAARDLVDRDQVPDNRVVELDHAWAALDSGVLEAPLAAEFAALRAQLGAKVRARGEGEQALTRWLVAVDAAIGRLGASLAGVAHGGVPPADAETLAANLLEIMNTVRNPGDARWIASTDAANRALALASSVVQRASFLQSLPAPGVADEAGEKQKVDEWRGFPEVSEGELHTVLSQRFADWRNAGIEERQQARDARRSRERERKAEQDAQRAAAIQRDVEAAEAAHAAGSVADVTRLLAAIDQTLKRGPANAEFSQRIESLRREHQRLRAWQRWSGGQQREQLAAEAQELVRAAAGKITIKAHADAISALRERWKELDKLGGASNQSVWLAFDGALKAAYAPVAEHLERLKLARDENLVKRNQIVDALIQAAACVSPTGQDEGTPASRDEGTPASRVKPDWRALARTLEEAQSAWRRLGPVEHTVPRKALQGDKAVTARYAAAVQALEAPLKSAYAEARTQREQLIASAKDLGGPEAVQRDVVDKVRKLQTQWQAVARTMPLPRRDEDRLWKAFKAATDAIFSARDAARSAREAEFSDRIKAREEIIERLAAASAAGSAPDVKRAMAEADAAWRAAPEIARPQAARLDARYRAERDASTRRLGEIAARASQARYDALIAKMELCHEREAVQDSGVALTEEQAADLEARWSAVENLPDTWNARLEPRFRSDADKAPGTGLPERLLDLEVALGIESPAEFSAARQRLKLLALKAAMEGRQPAATATSAAEIERRLLDAAAAPRPDPASRERLAKIIAAVRVRRPG